MTQIRMMLHGMKRRRSMEARLIPEMTRTARMLGTKT